MMRHEVGVVPVVSKKTTDPRFAFQGGICDSLAILKRLRPVSSAKKPRTAPVTFLPEGQSLTRWPPAPDRRHVMTVGTSDPT